MSSRQSLFYIAALLTGHVSAAGTTVGNGGFGSPSGIDEPKKTAPAMINDKPTMKSPPTVVEEVIERRLMPKRGREGDDEEEEKKKRCSCDNPQEKGIECSICLENIPPENGVTNEPCGHTFHKKCLSEWKKHGTDCPLCRGDFSLQVVDEIMKRFNFEKGSTIDAKIGGGTVLHKIILSAESPNAKVEMAKVILEKNSENMKKHGVLSSIIEVEYEGRTAFHYALLEVDTELVQLLLEHGAKIVVESYVGNTALHIAVLKQNKELVQLLLEHGADKTIKNDRDKTPLEKAQGLSPSDELEEIIVILQDLP